MNSRSTLSTNWKALGTAVVVAVAAVCLAASCAIGAGAAHAASFHIGQTFTKGGNVYKITDYEADEPDEGEVVLVKYGASSKKPIVNAVTYKGETFEVEAIGANAFNNTKGHKIASVTIGKNVDYIAAKAFYGCSKLKTVNMRTADVIDIDRKRGGYVIDDVDVAPNAFARAGAKSVKVQCGSANATYRSVFKRALVQTGMRQSAKVVK